MKQSRWFGPVLVSFTAIVLVVVSYSSASMTFLDHFDSFESGIYNSAHQRGNNSTIPILDSGEFNTSKILWRTDSVQLLWNPDEIRGQDLFHDNLISETYYTMSDGLLTLQIISDASIPDQPSERNSEIHPTSETVDDKVFKNDADYPKSMRIPATTSLLLVAIGLLSLRFTRRLRY